jgi:hypothetical protein
MNSECEGEHEAAKPVLSTESFSTDASDRHGGDALLTTDESEAFVGGGFDADLIGPDAERGGDVLLHRRSMRHHFGGLRDQGGVHIFDVETFLSRDAGAFFEDFEAADSLNRGVRRREPMADVRLSKGP